MDRVDYPSSCGVSQDLTGKRNESFRLEFPKNLDYFLSKIPDTDISFDQIIYNHTLYPYYSPFLSIQNQERILNYIKFGFGNYPNWLNFRMGYSNILSKLKYCPACYIEEMEQTGEPYWHRLHQLAGVLVCPKHRVRLYKINIEEKIIKNFNQLYSAQKCIDQNINLEMKEVTNKFLIDIAKNSEWLLNNRIITNSEETNKKILSILEGKGLFNRTKTSVYFSPLETEIHTFLERNSSEISELEIVPDLNSNNWINGIRRGVLMHPIMNIIFLLSLGENIWDLETKPILITEYKPFGSGPWPCMNHKCENYFLLSINECIISRSRNKKPIGKFSCNRCHSIYSRIGPDEKGERMFERPARILDYGFIWKEKLKQLWLDEKVTGNEMIKELNISYDTIIIQAVKLGLPYPRKHKNLAIKRKKLLQIMASCTIDREQEFAQKRDSYRKQWTSEIESNPNVIIIEIRKKIPNVYKWLYRHDKQWLNTNKPIIYKPSHKYDQSEWLLRDNEICDLIKNLVDKEKSSVDYPQKISISWMEKILSVNLSLKRRRKLPKTSEIIKKSIDDKNSIVLRRIHWTTQYYISSKITPNRKEFYKIAKLTTERIIEFKYEIDEAFRQIADSVFYKF